MSIVPAARPVPPSNYGVTGEIAPAGGDRTRAGGHPAIVAAAANESTRAPPGSVRRTTRRAADEHPLPILVHGVF